jgi:hypothetical protein
MGVGGGGVGGDELALGCDPRLFPFSFFPGHATPPEFTGWPGEKLPLGKAQTKRTTWPRLVHPLFSLAR